MKVTLSPNGFGRRRAALCMLVLLLASLWASVGHQHDIEDLHPQTHCAVCMQLHSAQLATGHATTIPYHSGSTAAPAPAAAQPPADSTRLRYQSRAPPALFFS